MKCDEVKPHTPFHISDDYSIVRAMHDHSDNVHFEIWLWPENFWLAVSESTNRHMKIAVEKRGIHYYEGNELLKQMISERGDKRSRIESYNELIKSLSSDVKEEANDR